MERFKAEKAAAPAPWLECRADSPSLTSLLFPFGVLAQLGERLICIQEVRSSILLGSTKPQTGIGSVAQVVRARA